MTPEGKALLRGNEGKILVVYDDMNARNIIAGSTVEGEPTIGIGRNLAQRGITEDEAEYLFANDVAEVEADLNTLAWCGVAEADTVRRDALANMRFNLGPYRFRQFKKMIAALLAKDYKAASFEVMNSAVGRLNPHRYSVLAHMIEFGTYPEAAH